MIPNQRDLMLVLGIVAGIYLYNMALKQFVDKVI